MDDDRFTRITLRIPRELHARLEASAAETSKSMNAEIVGRLESTYSERGADNMRFILAKLSLDQWEAEFARVELIDAVQKMDELVQSLAQFVFTGDFSEKIKDLVNEICEEAQEAGFDAQAMRSFHRHEITEGYEKAASAFEEELRRATSRRKHVASRIPELADQLRKEIGELTGRADELGKMPSQE